VGRVTETLARNLGSLVMLDRDQVLDFIEVDDPGVIVRGFTPEMREELLDAVGD